MNELNIKEDSIDQISQKIKNEVKRYSKSNQDDLKIVEDFKKIYTYQDIQKYHDEEFIKKAYSILLGRDVDEVGLNHYLNLLRTDKYTKADIISALRFSKEGREKNVNLLGAKKRYISYLITKIPLVGKIYRFLRQDNFTHKLQQLEFSIKQQISQLQDILSTKTTLKDLHTLQKQIETNFKKELNNLENDIKNTLITIEKNLNQALDKKADLQIIDYAKDYIKLTTQNLQNLIDEAKKRLPKEFLNQDELLKITKEEKHLYDALYVEFEDNFRGDSKSIKQRLKIYLPYIKKLPFTNDELNFLDLGCGRGEWLSLLKDSNYKNLKGVDLNHIMVEISKKQNLDVVLQDALDYLKNQKDNSFAVITGFHIIEHLPFETLVQLYDQVLRVLKPNGIAIFETPNPENVFVGTSNFYTDPTHKNPIPPQTSEFLLKQRGFKDVTIKKINYKNIHYEDPNINHLFASSTDYAVIGYKL